MNWLKLKETFEYSATCLLHTILHFTFYIFWPFPHNHTLAREVYEHEGIHLVNLTQPRFLTRIHPTLELVLYQTRSAELDEFVFPLFVQRKQVLNPQKDVSGPHHLETPSFGKIRKKRTDRPMVRTYLLSLLTGD